MHAALRKVLGEHVQQKGSLVAPDRLRFDFSHYESVTLVELQQIEDIVNEQIRRNTPADIRHMQYDDAVASGAIALFGEKYEDEVRVLNFGDGFSVELCGGTHVSSTGDIGVFKITSEGGVAAGIRRIEAVTGEGAMRWINANQQSLDHAAGLLKTPRDQVAAKVERLLRRNKALEKELAAARQQLLTGGASDVTEGVTEVDGIKVLATRMDGADAKTLRDAVDRFKDKLKSGRRHQTGRRAGRRPGWRQARFRTGRRQQSGRSRRGTRLGSGLGYGTFRVTFDTHIKNVKPLNRCDDGHSLDNSSTINTLWANQSGVITKIR
jgi:alanyl-tRNA synthetase